MKLFRIVYWFGSVTTERYIKAHNKDEAIAKFAELSNEKKVVKIEEVKE